MTKIERGDRVTWHWGPGVRHGEVEEVRSGRLIIDPPEVVVRWNDSSWKTYDEASFVLDEFGTWQLKR